MTIQRITNFKRTVFIKKKNNKKKNMKPHNAILKKSMTLIKYLMEKKDKKIQLLMA